MKRAWIATLVVLSAAGAAWAGIALAGVHNPQAAKDLAPHFELVGQNNRALRLQDFHGQVVLLNFFASWCGPCRQEMPVLDRIHQRYAALGFSVVGVNVDKEQRDGEKMLTERPVGFPIGFDPDSKVSALYRVDAMPSTVIIDRSGNVRYVHRGYQAGFEEGYVAQIKELVRE